MKPQLLQVAISPNRSFSLRRDTIPNINNRWHCHKEVELVWFHRGSGTQFIGDSIRRFKPGDVVLVGANLPHYWHFDHEEKIDCPRGIEPYSSVIHFTEDFWGSQFLQLPENKMLKNVLEKAKRGISFSEELSQQMAQQMESIFATEGTYQLIALIQCLLLAQHCDENNLLSSLSFQYDASDLENERLHGIYKYTLQNFHNKIKLQEIASLAGLTPNSFCRYFKHRTGKSYSQFLLEIRVGNACKLLINTPMTIKQICFESGFNNFTCFYKQFKNITGMSPFSYQKAHADK
ncbi:MAG TPA: AraC family transcriptional regulator [Runella sp.]|nr:AraC family transcriptional regulator [Runella sp.]HAO49372.1 AraC family transcriptional regulator [Runella sp.]